MIRVTKSPRSGWNNIPDRGVTAKVRDLLIIGSITTRKLDSHKLQWDAPIVTRSVQVKCLPILYMVQGLNVVHNGGPESREMVPQSRPYGVNNDAMELHRHRLRARYVRSHFDLVSRRSHRRLVVRKHRSRRRRE